MAYNTSNSLFQATSNILLDPELFDCGGAIHERPLTDWLTDGKITNFVTNSDEIKRTIFSSMNLDIAKETIFYGCNGSCPVKVSPSGTKVYFTKKNLGIGMELEECAILKPGACSDRPEVDDLLTKLNDSFYDGIESSLWKGDEANSADNFDGLLKYLTLNAAQINVLDANAGDMNRNIFDTVTLQMKRRGGVRLNDQVAAFIAPSAYMQLRRVFFGDGCANTVPTTTSGMVNEYVGIAQDGSFFIPSSFGPIRVYQSEFVPHTEDNGFVLSDIIILPKIVRRRRISEFQLQPLSGLNSNGEIGYSPIVMTKDANSCHSMYEFYLKTRGVMALTCPSTIGHIKNVKFQSPGVDWTAMTPYVINTVWL